MDCGDLLHDLLAHPPDPLWVASDVVGDAPLVHLAGQPLHDVELPPEHLARRLVPQRPRCPDRRRLERPEYHELALQVIGLQQAGGRRTHPDGNIQTMAVVDNGREEGLGGVADLDTVESLDANVARVGQLNREPRRQLVLDLAHQLVANRTRIRS